MGIDSQCTPNEMNLYVLHSRDSNSIINPFQILLKSTTKLPINGPLSVGLFLAIPGNRTSSEEELWVQCGACMTTQSISYHTHMLPYVDASSSRLQ